MRRLPGRTPAKAPKDILLRVFRDLGPRNLLGRLSVGSLKNGPGVQSAQIVRQIVRQTVGAEILQNRGCCANCFVS